MERWLKLKNYWVNKVDAFLVFKLEEISLSNLRYLTNFSGSVGIFLQTKNKEYLLVDDRYTERAKKEKFKRVKVISITKSSFLEEIIKISKKEKIKKLGLESFLPYELIRRWRKRLRKEKIKLIVFPSITFQIRKIKSKEEIEILKKAQEISDKIYEEILDYLQPGKQTEKEISFKIKELAIKKYGAEDISFEPIVAFGDGSAIPHYQTENKKIGTNGALLIDFGVKYKGYISDMTRTIWIGKKIDPDFKKVYEIVLTAQNLAIEKCIFNEKLKSQEVDKAARDYINSTKFKNLFLHSTGHGIGMDVHELPFLSPFSKDILEGQEVVTIEPGIYIKGKWGVRIEDTIVTKSGINLTKSPKDLLIL